MNRASEQALTRHSRSIPLWLTADHITSARLSLVVPTLGLYSHGFTKLPAGLILLNALLDYADGAYARWQRQHRPSPPPSLVVLPSKREAQLASNWGAYYDAMADKAFALPVWVAAGFVHPVAWVQACLALHTATELVSSWTRTNAYLSDPGSAGDVVTADAMGKSKQVVSMLGTALLVADFSVLGGCLLWASLPLALASVRAKMSKSTQEQPQLVLVEDGLDAGTIRFLAQAKALAPSRRLVVVCVGRGAASARDACLELGPLVSAAKALPGMLTLRTGEPTGEPVLVRSHEAANRWVDESIPTRVVLVNTTT